MISMVKKPLSAGSLFRLLKVFARQQKCSSKNMCAATSFKSYHQTNSEHVDSKTSKTSFQTEMESEEFGNLKIPLEKGFKFKQSKPVMHGQKRIIKIKRPGSKESDIFGNLSENNPVWYPDFCENPKADNDLSDDSVIIKNLGKRHRCPRRFLTEMKLLVKEKKVKEALDLFVEMRRNFVTPIHPHYTYMIGVCGKIGYTEMAFNLLRQMTDRSFIPTPATLTGLFNACAESPFPEYGLKKAHLLKEKIEIKNWRLTQITYHAMIKAFGKCGDLVTAFKIVDEMAKADIKIDVSTYSFLLMSCISNKEAGFTYAVEVWRKMKAKKCMPNVYTCNLLLRAARDCDIGSKEISCLLLQHWSNYSKRPYGFITKEELSKEPVLKLQSGTEYIVSQSSGGMHKANHDLEDQSDKLDENLDNNVPSYELENISNKNIASHNSETLTASLLSARPLNGPEILEIVNIKTPSDRLSLIGGKEGFLKFMHEAEVKPDIKTFALLLECLPDNIEEEDKLLSILDQYQMNPTIDFFNVLIKRRNFRKDRTNAQKVLLLINKYELTPDIMTFGALALGCPTLQMASTFIDEMKKFGSHPNIEIAGSLARQACQGLDFSYMKYVLELMEEEDIKPDQRLLSTLEKTLSNTRKEIILREQGKEVRRLYQHGNLQADFKEFFSFYEEWLKRMKFGCEAHPWLQYKTDIIDRHKDEKNV